jgi:hypothetical protein
MKDARVARVEKAFRFLVDEYGFRRYRVERTDARVVVKFRNASAGVAVETGPDRTEVLLTRLDSAARMAVIDRDGYAFRWWLLADLVGADVDPMTSLEEQAELLRAHGGRALVGEFDGLEEAATRRVPELSGG